MLSADTVKQQNILNYISCFDKISTEQKNFFVCKIGACTDRLADSKTAIRHLKNKHSEIRSIIQANKSTNKNTSTKIEISVKVSPDDILNGIVDLIVFNGMSLNSCNSGGIKKLTQPYVEGFKPTGISLQINRENIKDSISANFYRIKESIKQNCDKKLCCIMLDIATRHSRSVLGISIAFMVDGKPKISTIGMYTLRKDHRSESLFTIVKSILTDYGIDLNQILAITTDNGPNVKKIWRLMRAENEDTHFHVQVCEFIF